MTSKIQNNFRKEMFLQTKFKLLMTTYFITKMQFSCSVKLIKSFSLFVAFDHKSCFVLVN